MSKFSFVKWVIASVLCVSPLVFGSSAGGNIGIGSEFISGMASMDLYDDSRQRPVKVTLWYPKQSETECVSRSGSDICLSSEAKKDQVFILSPGMMGSALEYQWIGTALSSLGFVVVGVSHYSESWIYGRESINPKEAMKIWNRPLDVSFVIDQFQSGDALLVAGINWDNVTAIGHSAGGYTGLALAGAKLLKGGIFDYCQSDKSESDKSCNYINGLTAPPESSGAGGDFSDERVKRLILLDPALGPGISPRSIKSISLPVLIFGSEDNDFFLYRYYAPFYSKNIRGSKLINLNDGEGHFVYLNECDNKIVKQGIPLCRDREGVDRGVVHNKIIQEIFSYIFGGSGG
ncbi:MAG: hypothetical protein K6L80_15340 [Agarilytica sp.]